MLITCTELAGHLTITDTITGGGQIAVFDQEYQTGTFVDGSPFIIHPPGETLSLVSKTLDPGLTIDTYNGGIMLEWATPDAQGFDPRNTASGLGAGPASWYDAGLNEALSLPLVVDATVSPKTIMCYRGTDAIATFGGNPALPTGGGASGCATLLEITVLSFDPGPDAIKPTSLYVEGGKEVLTRADIDYDVFPLTPVPVAAVEPDWDRATFRGTDTSPGTANANYVIHPQGYHKYPYLHFGLSVKSNNILPLYYERDYPAYQAITTSQMLVGAVSEIDEDMRRELVERIVRDGLHVYSTTQIAGSTQSLINGGHGANGKTLAFFASFYLDRPEMRAVPPPVNDPQYGFQPYFHEDGAFFWGIPNADWVNGRPLFGMPSDQLGYFSNHIIRDVNGLRDSHMVVTASGVAQGGTSTTITVAASTASTAITANHGIYNVTTGEYRNVVSYTHATKVVVVDAAWGTIPAAGNTYEYYAGGQYQLMATIGISGSAYAVYLAGERAAWGNPAYFDYMRRWIVDDTGLLQPDEYNYYGTVDSDVPRRIWGEGSQFSPSDWIEHFYAAEGIWAKWGAAAPVHTTGDTAFEAIEGVVWEQAITFDQMGATISITGADAAHISVATTTLGTQTIYTLSMAGKDHEAPADANADNVYAFTVRATNPQNGLFSDTAMIVTVQDITENPVNAIAFTTQSLTASAGTLAFSPSKVGTVSLWFKVTTFATGGLLVLHNAGGTARFNLATASTGRLVLTINDASAAVVLTWTAPVDLFAVNVWNHFAAGWDAQNGILQLYANGVEVAHSVTVNNLTPDWANVTRCVGSFTADADIAEVYLNTVARIDLDTDLDLFRNAANKPVNLGASGATPTGSQPAVYLTGATASWHSNAGTAGSFVVASGPLTAASTSPSD